VRHLPQHVQQLCRVSGLKWAKFRVFKQIRLRRNAF